LALSIGEGGGSELLIMQQASNEIAFVSERPDHQLLGALLASLFSALVWTGLMAAMGAAIGRPPGAIVLMTVATVIAGFIAGALRLLFAHCLEHRE
jgi:hypothetical protein